MAFMKSLLRGAPCVLALFHVLAYASGFDDEFEQAPWAEIEVQLPLYPEEINLIPFRVGAFSDTQYLVDGNSISIGADGVVRYSLLVISASGARNISYEGMRCASGERRLYAFGRPDKTWSKARNSQWVRIRGDSNSHVVELYANYFCRPGSGGVENADDARRVLRQK